MKIAICPGSFDPITLGHIDIIERSAKIFDKVYVVVMVNPAKQPTFSTEERIDMIKQTTGHISNVVAESYTGLIADYAKEKGACTLVKGLRAVTDFEYEFQQALTNKKLNPDLETLFMVTNQEYMYLSSTIVRQIANFGGDIGQFVPSQIKDKLEEKMKKEI
ncbi:MAG: pantetheine-phosphate adenylyltransferase [Oscillospiraceae bacterium]|nr:pantetheine-phosphate adenylyltransferase [Oscillospiraceae bacterium]